MSDIDNISQLDDTPFGVSDAEFEAPSDIVRPPEPGEHTFMRVDDGNDYDYKAEVKKTDEGEMYLSFNFRVAIQGGQYDGRTTFTRITTRTWDNNKQSKVDEFIRAAHATVRPKSLKELAAVMPSIFGPFNAQTTWDWYCKNCKHTFLRGAKSPKSPKNYKGPKVTLPTANAPHVAKCPECNTNVGANLTITQFVVDGSNGKTASTPTATKPSSVVAG